MSSGAIYGISTAACCLAWYGTCAIYGYFTRNKNRNGTR